MTDYTSGSVALVHPGLSHCRVSRESLWDEVVGLPGLEPASYPSALVLLASVHMPHNVDRLARFTTLSREFVARCARRLCDNGVWSNGEVVCTWIDPAGALPAFLADVSVADGKLCRRTNEDGFLEWAAPGVWHKNYNLLDQQPNLRTSVTYEVPVQPEGGWEEEYVPEDEPAPAAPALTPDSSFGADLWLGGSPRESGRDAHPVWLHGDLAQQGGSSASVAFLGVEEPAWVTAQNGTTATDEAAADLFPDAVWLGK